MRKNIIYYGIGFALTALFLYAGCRKDTGFYKSKESIHEFSGDTYDFLKSQKGVYDSFLYVIDRVNLSDSLKKGKYTVFAPTNASFQQAISSVNQLRLIQGRSPQYLSNMPVKQLDTLVSRYIVRGDIPADSMKTQDGINLTAVRFGYQMHGKLIATNAEGYVEGGPEVIEYSDTKGVVYTRQWSTSKTVAIDIKTANGLVNVLERNHIFGFDEFIQRVDPTFSTPYTGTPLPIPGTIGLNQYDKGGEGVAYHDNDVSNNGNQYRPTESVDIEKASNGENGYDVGWTNPLEWMNYTVDIADTGHYLLLLRGSSPVGDATLHFDLDHKTFTGHIRIKNTLGWQNYYNISVPVYFPVKGVHVLRIVYDYARYNLRFLLFLPDGKPYPVPGTIPVVGFMPGGEGVGYHDNDASNNGGKFRPDEGVDIEQNKNEGGYDVGWTKTGEWMDYTIEVKETGQYNLAVTLGSPNDPNGGNLFHVEIDGKDITGQMTCPNSGGYQNWTDVNKLVYLTKGVHIMRFFEDTGGYNVRKYTFTAAH
jgi:uncharacterized surface protein with fasciclin (FAS1) repeats